VPGGVAVGSIRKIIKKGVAVSIVDTEHVLVVPTALLRDLGYFQGFCPDVERYLETLLSPEHTSYRPRNQMEEDPSFKQLIPYVIFRHTAANGTVSLFQYTRGKGQGERRLHRKRSIGIGGHISSVDQQAELHPYQEGMQRELEEEVFINSTYQDSRVGLLNDDQTEVGRVHLGVVHIFDVTTPDVRPREAEIMEAGFRPLHQLREQPDGFESWSQICLEALFPATARVERRV
jgi:predicted NUDIX family phosphoesterase